MIEERIKHEYKNEEFIPLINDFDDDYHKLDEESDFEYDFMSRVKKIRRRYNDYYAYQEACALYDQYYRLLVLKYGGEDELKMAFLLDKVNEYIPNYPELRKTKKNYFQRKMKEPRPVTVEGMGYGEYEHDIPKTLVPVPGKFVITSDKRIGELKDIGKRSLNANLDDLIKESISNDYDMLNRWYMNRQSKIQSMKASAKKKHKMMQKLNRKRLDISVPYKSLGDKIAEYEKRKRDKALGRNQEEYMVTFKGRMISSEEMEAQVTLSKLRELGIRFNYLSKADTKLIRGSKKKSKKDKRKSDKKNRKIEEKFISNFTNGSYSSQYDFEREMLELSGGRKW